MKLTALIIFLITYTGIIFTRLPKVNLDRPSAAFFGAVMMIVFGVLSFTEAISSIDFNTIGLLLGMMIIITTLELDGFFSLIAKKAIQYSRNPFNLLIVIVFTTGISSAFLVNDAVVLLFTPVIITICNKSKLNPIPYLIAEILSSNVGSAMTITGNPQNMLIGINSNISFTEFLFRLFPISFLGMIGIVFIVRWIYRKDFSNQSLTLSGEDDFKYNYASMKFSVPIFLLVMLLFFIGKLVNLSIPVIALFGSSLILIFGKIKPSTVIKSVDWVLLLFFSSLFIVVRAVEKVGLLDLFFSHISFVNEDFMSIGIIHLLSLFFSQIVSNVPFAILMLPLMKTIHSDILWLSLASASTLAGNFTIIGAMANLIVIESAGSFNIEIKFREFFKAGSITTILTFFISMAILYFQI